MIHASENYCGENRALAIRSSHAKAGKTAVIIYLQACPGKPRFSWISPDFQREPNYSLL